MIDREEKNKKLSRKQAIFVSSGILFLSLSIAAIFFFPELATGTCERCSDTYVRQCVSWTDANGSGCGLYDDLSEPVNRWFNSRCNTAIGLAGGACPSSKPACTSNNSFACSNNDVYWYDSCGVLGAKKQECGSNSTGAWSTSYCKDGNVFRQRTVIDRGCGGSACFANSSEEVELISSCSYKCSSGACIERPRIDLIFNADPSEGIEPLDVLMTASVSGTATGPIDYSFWWDCNNASNDIIVARNECGFPDFLVSSVSDTEQLTNYRYLEGEYFAKVIVSRGEEAYPVSASVNISVQPLFVPTELPDFFETEGLLQNVGDIGRLIASIATVVLAVMILIAGVQFLIGSGAAAISLLKFSFIGYGIVLLGYGIFAALQTIL